MPLERRQRRGIALIAAAALVCSVAGSPPAFAQPPDAVGTVAATVEPIQAPATLPSPPKTAPPASVTPPASAAPPPRAPATSGASAELPARAAPTHSPPSTGSAAKAPAIDRTGDDAGSLGGVVTGAGEGVRAKAPSVHTDSVGSPAHPRGLQANPRDAIPSINAESGARSSAPTSSAPPSIRAARVAALQRWFAYIWPAIPLGGGTGRASAVAAISRNLLRPAVAAAARTLILTLSNTPLPVDSPFAGDTGAANSRHPSLPASPTAEDGKKILYLVAFAALLALLAFTIWREFQSALRPGGRHP